MMSSGRDSGISMEHDDSTLTNEKSVCKLTYVQTLKQRFEFLCSEQQQHEFHSDTNWWLKERSKKSPSSNFSETEKTDQTCHSENKNQNNDEMNVETLQGQTDSQTEMLKNDGKERNEDPKTLTFTQNDDEGPNETDVDNLESDHENEGADSFEDTDDEENNADTLVDKDPRPVSLASRSSQNSDKLSNIINELLENEQSYVDSLDRGIKNYVRALDKNEIPNTLRGQKFHIFGNVENIYKFHKMEFLPQLIECNEDVSKIADTFISFLKKDYFYGYVLYAINSKKSERLCNNHVEFFQKVQDECGDRLGVNSFLLQPIQRLPRYKMLLMEVIKELGNTLESFKDQIAVCCVAEKNMQRLLDTVNESMSINDIHECYEINLLSQGKFKRMSEFEMIDLVERRRYRGKAFLFERCIVYTEQIDKEHLVYKGHYNEDKLGMAFKEGKLRFKLFNQRRGHQEVEFFADVNTVTEWTKRIHELLMAFIEREKKRIETLKYHKVPVSRLAPDTDSIRSSMFSTVSDRSTVSSQRSSSGSSSQGSFDIRKSQWYV